MASEVRTARTEADSLLVERLRDGDTTSLSLLMSRYGDRVYRLARGICRCEADAEEVTQDVFLTLARSAAGFEGRAGLWTWLYRVATNAALMKRRGKRYEVEVPLDDDLPQFLPDGHRAGARAFLVHDWSADPEEALQRGEARAILERALDRLPAEYRAVVVLRDVEGLSNEEVAEVVGETVACIKSRLHRARMALRERVTRHLAGHP
jgi:RNA polymerase sigma-70 factor, ECF subfamily